MQNAVPTEIFRN